jgi:hypothetical protein
MKESVRISMDIQTNLRVSLYIPFTFSEIGDILLLPKLGVLYML